MFKSLQNALSAIYLLVIVLSTTQPIKSAENALQTNCGAYAMVALLGANDRWYMSIQACAADLAALGTAEELGRDFGTEIEAHNWFYLLFGRRHAFVLAPIPAAP